MDEDVEVPLILGRQLLATSQALIDVSDRRMVLKVGDKEVKLKLSDAMKHPTNFDDSCYYLDIADLVVDDCTQIQMQENSLQGCLDESPEDAILLI